MSDTHFTVPASLEGERLDRSLALLTGRTRSEIADLIARGAVQVGGVEVRVRHRRMAVGEEVVAEFGAPREAEEVTANTDVPFQVPKTRYPTSGPVYV